MFWNFNSSQIDVYLQLKNRKKRKIRKNYCIIC